MTLIPGISEFVDSEAVPAGLFLVFGPAGCGKTMYCRQFIADGLLKGDHCIFISSTLTEDQFHSLLLSSGLNSTASNIRFINPFHSLEKEIEPALSAAFDEIGDALEKNESVRIVVDSLAHIIVLGGEKVAIRFVMDLSSRLKNSNGVAICTLADNSLGILGTFASGTLEIRMDEGTLDRSIRLVSIKGIYHKPRWVNFSIDEKGRLVFGDELYALQTCTLCGKDIKGTPFVDANFVFDSQACMETYRRFAGAYGSNISQTGLPSEAFNVSFFFIDIVGLSDPALSVKRQVQKIQALNKLVALCDAFKRAPKEQKIILPTGDGMAIGFLLNPELPLELAIQLHRSLKAYNKGKLTEDQIAVRIGLGSGPVFRVTDINNIENVWGPGIILARRVMDAGDNGHILLADKLAEELVGLSEKYRSIIKPISNTYELKHGQKITLYSAYSANDFGNAKMPARVQSSQPK